MKAIHQHKPGVSGIAKVTDNRYPWVDYLKGIAIILVVYRHILIGIERSGLEIHQALMDANMIFHSFRMPLFFILSGIFISRSLRKYNLAKLAGLKFDNILYPYLIWSVIQISLQIIFSGSTNSDRGLFDYLYILYDPRMLDQFWYLPALFNATMVFLIFKKKLKISSWVQLGLGLVLYFTASFFHGVSMMSDWMEFFLFFVMGDLISKYIFRPESQRALGKAVFLLATIPIFIIVQMYYLTHEENYYLDDNWGKLQFLFISLTGCAGMFILSFNLQHWRILTFLRIVGFYSLFIYVMHVIVSAAIRMLLIKFLGVNNVLILLISGVSFGILIPILFYHYFGRDGFAWFLFAPRRPGKVEVRTREPDIAGTVKV